MSARHRRYDAADDAAARDFIQGEPVEIRPGRILHIDARPPARPDGTTILFVHGGGGNKAQWRNQFREAAARGYGVAAWDALGHGASADAEDAMSYAGAESLADAVAVFDRIATARNVIVGHSMGGRLSLALLAHLARTGGLDRVTRAMLVGSAAPGPVEASTSRGTGLIGRTPPVLLKLLRPVISEMFRRRAWHRRTPPALIAAEGEATRRNRMDTIRTIIAHPPPVTRADLAGITIPVLVLAGENDRLVPPHVASRLVRALPNARLQLIEGAAHQIMIEQPEATSAALFAFLAEREAEAVGA